MKWDGMMEDRIKAIRIEFENDPDQHYIGPTAIQVEYHLWYPTEELPPVRTIGTVLKDLDLSKPNTSGTTKGAAKYLRYPDWTICKWLGGRVMEVDFMGEKFITGRIEPIHFIGHSFKKEPRLHHYERVERETTDVFIEYTQAFFDWFKSPDYAKMDNAMAMIFLLKQGVIPIFSVPRQPFSQASIEGNNSVFDRKFWSQF